jgi:site-specific DNA recombinase
LADGTEYGGQKLYRRIYRGQITHKGNAYPGEHPLSENRVNRATAEDAKHPSLPAGMVFDENGERLTPNRAIKKGTRYRYYVSTSLIAGAANSGSNGRRIPAANLENLVIAKLRASLADQGGILDAIQNKHSDAVEETRLIARSREIAEELGTLGPDQIRALLMTLLSRVD